MQRLAQMPQQILEGFPVECLGLRILLKNLSEWNVEKKYLNFG
jgi:hypothetical protein